jgi:hypothetical protein
MPPDRTPTKTTSTIGPNPEPQQQLPDLHIPGAYSMLFFTFLGGAVAPKFFAWVGNREQAKQARDNRELDIRQQGETNEQQLLRTLIENQAAVTAKVIESNREMAQELRGLSQAIGESNKAIGESNKIHNEQIADIQLRLKQLEQSTPVQNLAN